MLRGTIRFYFDFSLITDNFLLAKGTSQFFNVFL